jgi:transposase
MAKTFRPYDPDQSYLLPPSLRDWLPPDHLVYFVSDLADGLDLTAIFDTYEEERGYPPYHPLMLVKVLLYGYAVGIRSSRKLERASKEDVAFRVLCAGNEPNFRTISDFRKRHLEALAGLFAQVLLVAKEAGLVKLGHVAIDGSKVKANASKHKAMSYGRMIEEEKRLQAEIERLLRAAVAEDEAEDARHGSDNQGDELPEELRHRQSRLRKIREAKAALEARARAEAEEAGHPDPETVEPDAKAQRNFTDPDSRIMLGSDKAFVQAYNVQLAVDSEHQIIVAEAVTQQGNDKLQLIPMTEAVCDSLAETPIAVSGDSGYFSEEVVKRLELYEIDPFVAPGKISHREWREATPPTEPLPLDATARERMRHKLRTERGRAEYDKRKVTVEPVFGQLKTVNGMRHFLLRGLGQASGEWRFACTAHNLLKVFRAWRSGLIDRHMVINGEMLQLA